MPIYVNGHEITDDEVFAEVQYHPADSFESARDKACRALVIRRLLLEELVASGLLKQPATAAQEEEATCQLLENAVTAPEASTDDCKRYWEQNLARFRDPATKEQLPFALVEERIRQYLKIRSYRTGVGQYLKLLASGAKIVGFELEKVA